MPKLRSGYAFCCTSQDWRNSPDDDWELRVITPRGDEKFLGYRQIDGTQHGGFLAADGTLIAQRTVMLAR
jgi:hypothetical protein